MRPGIRSAAAIFLGSVLVACGSGSPALRASTTSTTAGASLVVADAQWRLPAPVSRAAVVADGGDLLVAGGLATGDVSTGRVVRVNPGSGASSVVGQLAVAVHDAAGALLHGQLQVFGGGASATVATVQRLTGGQGSVVGRLPRPRSDLATATIGGTVFVVGGFDGTTMDPTVLATTDGVTFRSVGMLAVPVRYPAVAVAAGAIWVMGGQLGTAESSKVGGQSDAIQRFDPMTGVTRVVGHLPTTLGHAMAVTLGGQLYVLGGRLGNAPTSRMLHIDTVTGAATDAGGLPAPRSDAAAIGVGDTAWLLGGETTSPAHPLDGVVIVRRR